MFVIDMPEILGNSDCVFGSDLLPGPRAKKVTISKYMRFFPLGNEAINKVSMGGIWELKDGEEYLMCASSRTSKGTIRRA